MFSMFTFCPLEGSRLAVVMPSGLRIRPLPRCQEIKQSEDDSVSEKNK